MNINVQNITGTFFGSYSVFSHKGLKSTEEKLERQEKRDSEVAFFEKQKENLKNRKCATVEEIAEKLDMLQSYDDQIAGIKAAYNNEQMWHILDEAREIGEKIAEAAEKMEPKTPEELVEEATGTEDTDGLLDEILDDAAQMQEEVQEAMQEEVEEQLSETMPEDLQEQLSEEVQEQFQEEVQEPLSETAADMEEQLEKTLTEQITEELEKKLAEKIPYKSIDLMI